MLSIIRIKGSMELVNVVCLYWGNKYKTEYVNVLYNMVKRNLTIPHKFIIYTDHVKMHKLVPGENVEVRQLPFHTYEGWWNKLTLFSPEAKLEGTCLYLDLDVVILENIDCFFTFEQDKKFIGMNDFNKSTKLFNSSVMRFNNEVMTKYVWQEYLNDKKTFDRLQGDQNVISQTIKKTPHNLSFPDEWTFSAKWHDRDAPRFHKEKWTFERKNGAKIAVFHGKPNPHELINPHPHESINEKHVEWVKNYWN
jgi:alpha-N-acetylglucosamine transferase